MSNFKFQNGSFKTITLCGSSKFKTDFIRVSEELTLAGNLVISLGIFGHVDHKEIMTTDIKVMLDKVHKQKIDMCDAIYVINKDGYIGESTRGEIEYAIQKGKTIYFMEDLPSDSPYLDQ